MPYECQRRKKHFISSCLHAYFFFLTALAIRCYVCAPNITNYSSANMCGDPTDTINCTDSFYVSCISISITGKASNIVGFTVYSLNCGPKLLCSEAYKDYTCDSMKNATKASGVELGNCEISCCQEDFCNKPLGVSSASSFPRSTTPGPAGSTVTVKLSVGSTNFPLNCALFGILGVISVAVTNIF